MENLFQEEQITLPNPITERKHSVHSMRFPEAIKKKAKRNLRRGRWQKVSIFRIGCQEDYDRGFRAKTNQDSTTTATLECLQEKTVGQREVNVRRDAPCHRQNLRLVGNKISFHSGGCGQLPKCEGLRPFTGKHYQRCQDTFRGIETNVVWVAVAQDGPKSHLVFIGEGVKVNSRVYQCMLGRDVCHPSRYVFTQDSAPAHTANLMQNWCKRHFILHESIWPPSSPGIGFLGVV